jgi:hypothetical protein
MKTIAMTTTWSMQWSIFNLLRHIATSNDNNNVFSVVLQGATAMIDCDDGAQDCISNI